ncbi:MAG TPA: hypothetical protein VIS03_20555 [Kiloniellaceae bacterium]
MRTQCHDAPCLRGLLAVAIMAIAMFTALAAGSDAAATSQLVKFGRDKSAGSTAVHSPSTTGQSPSMAASFIATPVEPWIFSLPVM